MHRRLFILTGEEHDTLARAQGFVAALAPDDVLVVTTSAGAGAIAGGRARVRDLLGQSFAACIVGFHGGLDPDLLGQCHGLVRGGGALIVMVPAVPVPDAALAAYPYLPDDVTDHLARRVRRVLAGVATAPEPLQATHRVTRGTADQARAVTELVALLDRGGRAVLTADRGRGKSAALGLALHRAQREGPIALIAAHADALREVVTFAGDAGDVRVLTPLELLRGTAPSEWDAVIVDEAAQIPVDLLRRLTESVPTRALIFATTTHGYEGTGRGFLLRFVEWLQAQGPVVRLELEEPIRWSPGDPVERAVFDALLLDAEAQEPPARLPDLRHRHLEAPELAADDGLLRAVFGLLVQAHYRTTPRDLHRLLDAPNLDVHASFAGDTVVAASLVAREGGLPPELCAALGRGAQRIVGHALPETFASHLGYPEAAAQTMARSVRIAVHPHARRAGVASALVAHVHGFYDVELFGTLFGATAELVRFRRQLGYEVVRVSASASERSGLWSVAMVRPNSSGAAALMAQLRADLARDLPLQLELLRADRGAPLQPELEAELRHGLPSAAALPERLRDEIVTSYAFGPRTLESAATAVDAFVRDCGVEGLDPSSRRLVESRLLHRTSWAAAAAEAGLAGVPAAMRAMRRAVRALASARGLGHPNGSLSR